MRCGGEGRVFPSEIRRLSGRQIRKPRQGSSRDAEAEREPQQGSVPGRKDGTSLRHGTYAGGQSARNPPRALVPHVSGPQLLYHGGVSSQAPGPAFPPAELFRGNSLRFPAASSLPTSIPGRPFQGAFGGRRRGCFRHFAAALGAGRPAVSYCPGAGRVVLARGFGSGGGLRKGTCPRSSGFVVPSFRAR